MVVQIRSHVVWLLVTGISLGTTGCHLISPLEPINQPLSSMASASNSEDFPVISSGENVNPTTNDNPVQQAQYKGQLIREAFVEPTPENLTSAQRPPSEKSKVSLPEYRIEPPDILIVTALRMAPKDPYMLQSLDVLQVVVSNTIPEQPIAGFFQIDSSGRVALGPTYGAVEVAGKSIIEATDTIRKHLGQILVDHDVSLSLSQMAGQQQIAAEHLVSPDGTVNLGTFGSVYISGMTLKEAKEAIENHLTQFLDKPKISIDVFAYNSKVFYVIAEGGGMGDQIVRLPITGNETVLDALAQIGGLSRISSKRIWIARPGPSGMGCEQILPVDFDGIVRGANTETNYQVLPGDRIFIAEDRLIRLDSTIQKLTTPFERIFGFTLLGTQTIQTAQRFPQGMRTF